MEGFCATTNRAFQALNLEVIDQHILFADGDDSEGLRGGSDDDWHAITRADFRLKQEKKLLVSRDARQARKKVWSRGFPQ